MQASYQKPVPVHQQMEQQTQGGVLAHYNDQFPLYGITFLQLMQKKHWRNFLSESTFFHLRPFRFKIWIIFELELEKKL